MPHPQALGAIRVGCKLGNKMPGRLRLEVVYEEEGESGRLMGAIAAIHVHCSKFHIPDSNKVVFVELTIRKGRTR